MLKQLRHKRFIKTMANDLSLSTRCYWYAQAATSIAPVGTENDNDDQRPGDVPIQE